MSIRKKGEFNLNEDSFYPDSLIHKQIDRIFEELNITDMEEK